MDAAARRRTYDIPKSDSAGLAEWTTKIKALQRQVDEDEEAETRRLEEEIMVSRMSRMRRSTLQSRPSSHDLSVNNLSRVASPVSDVDHPQSAEDKQRDREATMRKLMGRRSPVPPDSPRSKTPLDNPPPAQPKPSNFSNKPRQESISLAAFMGSRETGPRMNKHAPQQDAHDPTQFEQRRSITSPHPVFGKSGVAMPGLVPKSPLRQSSPSPRSADIEMASPSAQSLNLRERKISTPAVARRYVEKIESESFSKPSPSQRIRDTRERVRERTMSTPSGPGPGSRGYTTPSKPSSSGVEPTVVNKQPSPIPQAHNILSTPSTPNLHRHSYTPGPLSNETKPDSPRKTFPFLAQPGRTESEMSSRLESPTLPAPTSNLRQSPSPSMPSTSSSRQTAAINTQTLARPVEPKPKPSLRGPTIVSYNRSPAFVDRTPPKGVTPSLSRLQGRGFVQNMVKVSAELESSTGPSPFPTPERARSESQKRVSVLDRWTGTEPAVSTPMGTPSPVPMRKAKTLDPVNATKLASPGVPQPSRPITAPKRKSQTFEKEPDTSPPLSKSPSKGILVTSKEKEKPAPATPSAALNERVRGVGSSNTLVSYIKPVKTGDSEPPSPVRSKTPTANDGTDELGVRKRKSSGKLREKSVSFAASPPRSKAKSVADVLPSPSKPLSHPTKDRAKKPKRVKITTVAIREDKDKQSGPTLKPKALLNVADSDPSKPPSTSSGPALPALDLPPPSPTVLLQSSDPSSRRPHIVSVRLSKSRSPSPQPPAQPLVQAIPSEEHFLPSTRQKVADRWANGPIIGVKPITNGRDNPTSISTSPLPTPTGGNFGKIALPGLSETRISSPRSTDKLESRAPSSPVLAKEPPQEKLRKRNDGERRSSVDKPQPRRPPVPHKPSRIPSTGNRATVMDVAQVWSEHERRSSQDASSPHSPISPLGSHPLEAPTVFDRQGELGKDRECEREGQEQVGVPKVDVNAAITGWDTQTSVSGPSTVEEKDASLKLLDLLNPTEKKKSSWEKYSELIMPALEEEWTPAPSPMPTLNKAPTMAVGTKQEQTVPAIPEVKGPKEPKVDYIPIDLLSATLNPERETVKVSPTDLVTFDFPGYVVPKVDVRLLLKSIPQPALADPGVITVSVDVVSIVGSTSGTISTNTSTFYDTEILAVIQRAKVKSSGLVDTKVWGWVGKDAKVGLKEEKALGDLAKRYGTKLVPVEQYHEPVDMVTVLGGTLITRQGTRAHWSSENTTMHLVRSANGLTFIDEQHLSVQNLCSGFSYCLSILQVFYVWNGRGARPEERKAAFDYAVCLCGDADSVVVLDEGENDEDEMFWAVLGDGDREYAKASHWSWRSGANTGDPQMWKISASGHQFTHIAVSCIPSLDDGVFILDIVCEMFVLVGGEARDKREDIRLALEAAKALVSFVEPSRPLVPPIHVLVLPSQIPQDLRLAVRDPGFGVQGGGPIEHMNILSLPLALDHLNTTKWHRAVLGDKALLPLGLSPHDFD